MACTVQWCSSFRFGSGYDQHKESRKKFEHDLAFQCLEQQLIMIKCTKDEFNYGFVWYITEVFSHNIPLTSLYFCIFPTTTSICINIHLSISYLHICPFIQKFLYDIALTHSWFILNWAIIQYCPWHDVDIKIILY